MANTNLTNVDKVQNLSEDDVRMLLGRQAANVTPLVFKRFLTLCHARDLNPFLNEAYLIPFRDGEGVTNYNIVVSKDVFLQRAAQSPDCEGYRSGVIVFHEPTRKCEERDGSLVLSDEVLVGGWAIVRRRGWVLEVKKTVSMKEYCKNTRAWKNMPATMIAKVALVQAIRDAYPSEYAGMYTEEELKDHDATISVPSAPVATVVEVAPARSVKISAAYGVIESLLKEPDACLTATDVKGVLLDMFGVQKISELTDEQADGFLEGIAHLVDKKKNGETPNVNG